MLNLPDPDDSLLRKSPLELVVIQIRFENRENVAEPRLGFAFRDALSARCGGIFERVEPIKGQGFNVNVGPSGEPQVEPANAPSGWRTTSTDGQWAVVLLQDSLAVETRRYPGWQPFRLKVEEALQVVAELVGPEMDLRLGLRYIDRITEVAAGAPTDWVQYLQPALSGFLVHEAVGAAVKVQQHITVFDLGEAAECRFVHGTLPGAGDAIDYVLDYDLYHEDPRPFSVDTLMATLDKLHVDAKKLFEASTTPALKQVFA